MMEGPSADSEEKREPASDIDTAQVNSLKVLDPEWPIREADIDRYLSSARPSKAGDLFRVRDNAPNGGE